MIFRIRLPRLENLLGLDSDDSNRTDVGRETRQLADPGEVGFIYHVCTCICTISGYMDGNFYGMFHDGL